MKIGDYVKYHNQLWEITSIEDTIGGKMFYYKLNCRTADEPDIWVGSNLIEETDISQLYFELWILLFYLVVLFSLFGYGSLLFMEWYIFSVDYLDKSH